MKILPIFALFAALVLFSGCLEGSTVEEKDESIVVDDSCEADEDCGEGFTCEDEVCTNVDELSEIECDVETEDCDDEDGEEAECEADEDCGEGFVCIDSACVEAETPECEDDEDCDVDSDETCVDGFCVSA